MSDLFATDEIVGEQENDDEFSPDRDEQDDEATMEAEDRLGREMSPEEELAMLKEQSEIPIESLRSMYKQIEGEASSTSSLSKRKRDSETVDASSKKTRRDVEEDDTDTGMAALEALEASAERAQKTLASRPYLLTPWVKLREYQQIGLNWLVSLQSRRLNGILADGELCIVALCSEVFALRLLTNFFIIFHLQRWGWVRHYKRSPYFLTWQHTKEFGALIWLWFQHPSLSTGKPS
jgi:SNF2 family DNA or RNA helicase